MKPAALLILALASGCSAHSAVTQPEAPIHRIVLGAEVPGHWLFCVEPRSYGPIVCEGTVTEIRERYQSLRFAE